MELLPIELRARLPPLRAIDEMDEPFIRIHYTLGGSPFEWWVIGGEPHEDGFTFFGFISGLDHFRYFTLSELERKRGPAGQTVVRDESFTEGGLSEVVPAPDS
jgi:hypothetical protein